MGLAAQIVTPQTQVLTLVWLPVCAWWVGCFLPTAFISSSLLGLCKLEALCSTDRTWYSRIPRLSRAFQVLMCCSGVGLQ